MRKISQLEVIKFFWDNSKFYNRCYITMISNCALYLRFETEIELERIISRFKQYCKDCKLNSDNITIKGHTLTFLSSTFTNLPCLSFTSTYKLSPFVSL